MKTVLSFAVAVMVTLSTFAQGTGSQFEKSPSGSNFFIRPLVYWVHPTAEGYSDAGAAGLSFGAVSGAKKEHEISVEFAYTYWSSSQTAPGFSVSGKEHYLPILMNYRYLFGSEQSKVRFYVGPSIGFTRNWIEVKGRSNYATYSVTTGDWSFTVSGSAGVLIKLANKIDLDVGYRYLHSDGGKYTVAGYRFEGEAGKAHMFYGGLNFRL
jgi:opacity protein-like surface antigen